MKKKQKFIFIVFICLIAINSLFYIVLLRNVNFLLTLAEGLDRPSKLYYYVIEKIYRLSESKNIGKEILENMSKGRNKHLHDIYIQVLGITGESDATIYLIKNYAKYQNDTNRQSTIYYIIDSLGAIGNTDAITLLERLLINYNEHDIQVPKYSILRSLYLVTGKTYNYIDNSGKETTLKLNNELINARKVIENSKNRSRTFEEMKIIDKVYRPPDWEE